LNLRSITFFLVLVAFLFSFASCDQIGESDHTTFLLVSFFDLRDRETFIQITNTDPEDRRIHVQIFNVPNNCNENDFFDDYTTNDTHVYNMKDIKTNNGNPSGVVLPENAYGIAVFTVLNSGGRLTASGDIMGNVRILDNNGYEYRTNLLGVIDLEQLSFELLLSFNFNKKGMVTLSDVIGFTLDNIDPGSMEVFSADIVNINLVVDVDILDLNENVFSCRNVIFACTDQDNPRLEELLEEVGEASVASFEYGINNAIPHSKGGELLCPGNNIQEGFVKMIPIQEQDFDEGYGIFIGMNNGNGRGSMDSFWFENPLAEDEGSSG